MKNIFKRLGTQIILLSVAAITVTVVAILMISVLMFGSYNDDVLVKRAEVSVNILQNEVEERVTAINSDFRNWSEQSSFVSAMTFGQTAYFEKEWENIKVYEGDFCAISYSNGNTLYRTDNYPFTSLDLGAVARGESAYNGIMLYDGVLTAVHAGQVSANGVSCGLIIGFKLDSTDWLDSIKKLTECDITIFNGNMRYSTTIVNPSTGQRVVGTAMAADIESKVIAGHQKYNGKADILGRPYYVAYAPMSDMNGKTVGAYFSGDDASESNAQFAGIIIVSIIAGAAALLLTALIVFIFTRKKVIEPIGKVTAIAGEIKDGKLSTSDVTHKFADNEVGQFAESLRDAKQALSLCISDIGAIMEKMAGGDFTEKPTVEYPGDMNSIAEDILRIEHEFGVTMSRMEMSSNEVLSGSDQMAEGSQSLADGTTKQAAAIQQISARISDVSSKVAMTAQNAAKLGEISRQTEEEVGHQDSSITNMVGAMDKISSTSSEIGNIIKTIEDISFQTNILALNAAVEAARAGDAGKGFAVVADEVRNLANKSAEAAKSTTDLINAAIQAVENGSRIADETAESMKKVKEKTAETAQLITLIENASAEQTDAITQINSGIEQISQVVQMNSATAEETAASCQELSGQSRLLKDQVARFRIES